MAPGFPCFTSIRMRISAPPILDSTEARQGQTGQAMGCAGSRRFPGRADTNRRVGRAVVWCTQSEWRSSFAVLLTSCLRSRSGWASHRRVVDVAGSERRSGGGGETRRAIRVSRPSGARSEVPPAEGAVRLFCHRLDSVNRSSSAASVRILRGVFRSVSMHKEERGLTSSIRGVRGSDRRIPRFSTVFQRVRSTESPYRHLKSTEADQPAFPR